MFNKEAMFLNDFELIYELSRFARRLFKGDQKRVYRQQSRL